MKNIEVTINNQVINLKEYKKSYKNKDSKELDNDLNELKRNLFELRCKTNVSNIRLYSQIKKYVARISTEISIRAKHKSLAK